jgi:inner membrane protein
MANAIMTSVEPLAHTLAGACLAESGLKRLSPLAASTLIVAANLPDLDGACYLHSADAAFAIRRGWTHGILAVAVLPVLLTFAMVAFDRVIRRKQRPALPPSRPVILLALSYVGVLSHPFLDWLNNYGVRLLMPFSDRWFYGDALFIADPWLWLILGAAVMLSWTARRTGRITAIAVSLATTLLVAASPLVAGWARTAWMLAIGAWLVLHGRVKPSSRPRLAKASLLVAMAYIMLMLVGSRLAERQVRQLARHRGWVVGEVAAMPIAAEPLLRNVIAVSSDRYRFVPVNWLRGPAPDIEVLESARGSRDAVVEAALDAPFVQGVRRWLRFPSYEVRPLADGGHRVIVRDARFAVGYREGFGVVAIIDLDRARSPRPGPSLSR